jgi:hypothetical protein
MDGRHRDGGGSRSGDEEAAMIEVNGKVIYTDGQEAEYRATQREFAAGRYACGWGCPRARTGGGLHRPDHMTRYLAYSAIMRGMKADQFRSVGCGG